MSSTAESRYNICDKDGTYSSVTEIGVATNFDPSSAEYYSFKVVCDCVQETDSYSGGTYTHDSFIHVFLRSFSGYCRKEPENNENENWYQLANSDSDHSFTCVPCESYFSQICCSENEVIESTVRFDLHKNDLQIFFSTS